MIGGINGRRIGLLAFTASIALGAATAWIRDEAVRPVRAAGPTIASLSAACAVRAMPDYQRALALRDRGQCEQAAALLGHLAQSSELSEPERAFCRDAMAGRTR